MLIRWATENDLPAWYALATEVSKLFQHPADMGAELKANASGKGSISRYEMLTAVDYTSGNNMGFIFFSREKNEITWFAVSEKYRGKGVGGRLLKTALRQLDTSKDITVCTFCEDYHQGAAARTIYKKYGFTKEKPAGHNGQPRVEMTCPASVEAELYLFTEQINNWDDWGNIFQSIPAFTPLVEHIFLNEKMPLTKIENLTPGSNAVFKVGDYVIKIFAPQGMGEDYGTNVDVELFGMKLANTNGVPAPKLIADGEVSDKYLFRYMIMEYINGKTLIEIEDNLSYDDKVSIGKQIRSISNKLNKPCGNFTSIDVMQYAKDNNGWAKEGFPAPFLEEILAYLADFNINQYKKVYCHGDWTCENILVDDKLNVYIIDFADAMYAPAEYETVYIASGLFCFEKPYMAGYFGDYDVGEIVNLCMTWLPVHAWGHATTAGNLGSVDEITSFAIMRERLYELVEMKKNIH